MSDEVKRYGVSGGPGGAKGITVGMAGAALFVGWPAGKICEHIFQRPLPWEVIKVCVLCGLAADVPKADR